MNRRIGSIVFFAGVLLLALLALPVGASSDQPLVLNFDIRAVEPGGSDYAGTVTGVVNGTVEVRHMCSIRSNNKTCQTVIYEWIVTGVDGKSFTAVTRGQCNHKIGVMRLWGDIANGFRAGEQIAARARLYDAGAGHYQGRLIIFGQLESKEGLVPLRPSLE